MHTVKKFAWYGSSVAFAALLALTLLVSGPVNVATAAANDISASATSVVADGVATTTITYEAAANSQLVQFNTSRGTFSNGSTSITVAAASTGTANATATLKADTAGTATVTATNLSAGPATNNTTITFFGAPNYAGAAAVTTDLVTNNQTTDVDNFLTTTTMAVGAYTLTANTLPTGRRASTVTITTTTAGAADTVGTVALVGTDEAGNSISETVTLVQGGTASSVRTFKTVTSATQAGWVTDGTDDSLTIGYGAVVNVANNTTGLTVASGDTVDLLRVTDSAGRAVRAASVTMTITGDGTWTNTGGKVWIGQTDATGDITAQAITLAAGATSTTVTVNVTNSLGSLTLTALLIKGGNTSTATFTQTVSLRGINTANATVGNLVITDSAGNRVTPGATPTLSCTGNDADGLALLSTTTVAAPTNSSYPLQLATAAGTKGGVLTCTWTVPASGTNPATAITGTFTVTVSTATISTVTVTAASKVNPGIPVTVTVDLLDANGNRVVANASTVTVAVNGTAGGNLIVGGSAAAQLQTGGVNNGRVTVTFVPGDVLGTFTITAIESGTSKVGFSVVQVTNEDLTPTPTPPPAEGDGTFTGTIAASGVSLVVFGGGTVAELAAAADAAGLVSVSLTVDGKFVVYIVGAPAFVNAAFNAAFADGIAASTPVIVKK